MEWERGGASGGSSKGEVGMRGGSQKGKKAGAEVVEKWLGRCEHLRGIEVSVRAGACLSPCVSPLIFHCQD